MNSTGAVSGDTVTLYNGTNAIVSITLDDTHISIGKVAVDLTTELTEGNNNITAKVKDVAGKESPASAAIIIKSDTIAPTALSLGTSSIVANAKPTDDLSTISATDASAVNYTLVTGDGSTDNNLFTIDSNKLKLNPGKISSYLSENIDNVKPQYSIRIKATDAAGNSTESIQTLTLSNVVSIVASDPNAAETLPTQTTNPGQFTLTRTGITTADLTVNYTISGTATNGTDYQALTGTATFIAGSSTATIDVNPIDDNIFEGAETFTINLNGNETYTLDSNGFSASATIADNDKEPTISISDVNLQEGNSGTTNATFTVSLSNPSTKAITVDYATSDGTATAGSDYTKIDKTTLTFAPGETSKTVNVSVNGDTLYEADETFKLNLTNAVNATISNSSATGTILNDDLPVVSIAASNPNAAETLPTQTTNPEQFTLTRTGITTADLTVNYTISGTATNGTDYQALTGTATFIAGSSTATIDVNPIDDNIFERAETVTINLNGNETYTLDSNGFSAFATIADNDKEPTISISDVNLQEGNSGTTNATCTVSLSNPSTKVITVDYATADGTATAGSDYTKIDKTTLTFAPGETSKTVNVAINGDTILEPNETFKVNLSDAVDGTIITASAIVTIVNDDDLPVISIAASNPNAAETLPTQTTNPGQFTLTRTGITTADLTVNYTISGTATNGTDYQTLTEKATFKAGSSTAIIDVNPIDDKIFEGAETVTLTLLNGNNYSLGISYSAATKFVVADGYNSVTVGYFNDDKIADLAVVGAFSNQVSILLGKGDGSFGTAANFDVGTVPLSVAVGDFNGDGQSDLTVANSTSDNVSILLGDGKGSFGTATNFGVGRNPQSVTVSYFNDDKIADLAVANLYNNNVSILLGDGKGSFGSATNFGVGIYPTSVTVGYFNNDKIADLAVANSESKNVSILLGDGKGSFGSATNFGENLRPQSVTIGDFNGDGKSDFAVANAYNSVATDNVSIFLGNGNGGFAFNNNLDVGNYPKSLTIGDFNGDGKSDLAVAKAGVNNVSVFLGNGDGSFGTANNLTVGDSNDSTWSVTNGDFNGDGRSDLAVGHTYSRNVSVLLNNATVTITDNDSKPTISISDVNLQEENSGTTNATFTVSLSNPSTQTITFDYATADVTATADSDYTKIDKTTLTFAPGETSKTVNVAINGDTLYETDETFKLNLTNAVNASISNSSATGTILNDDLPVISIVASDPNAAETLPTQTTNPGQFTLTRTGITTADLTVNYTISGTATNGTDYQALTGTATFIAGSSTATIDVNPIDDNIFEGAETVTINLNGDATYTLDSNSSAASATITDNDTQPTISISDVNLQEGNSGTTNATFTVSLSNPSTKVITIDYATVDGTATAGSDYTKIDKTTLTFAPGETSKTVNVAINGDTILEPNETFKVNLSDAVDGTIITASATGTIVNDDDLPVISIAASNPNAAETLPTQTTNPGQFTLTRTGITTADLTVNYTISGTATNGTDYQALTGTATFIAGSSTATIDVNPIDDNIFEGAETVTINLNGNETYTLDSNGFSASATIADNDKEPTISISDVNLQEGNSGTTNATFSISLSNPSTKAITVDYATSDGTATAGSDYTKINKTTLTFAPGETSKTVNVAINGDTLHEADETFKLNLTNAVNATISNSSATGTILNDDLPVVSIAASNPNAAEILPTQTTNPGQFTLTRTGITTDALTVNYTISGTATNRTDYQNLTGTATFIAGSSTATIDVNPIDDNIFEGAETVTLTLLGGNGYALDNSATNLPVGLRPTSVTVGYFNNDNIADLAVANVGDGNVSILLGKKDGSFDTAKNFAVGNGSRSVTVGDFNNDDIDDLAVANINGNVSILLGKGDGSFDTAKNFAVGAIPLSVTVDDFNNDNIADLAVANADDGNVSILLGKGNGSFDTAKNFDVGSYPQSVTVGYFNNDNIVDLAVANTDDDNVSILLGKGDGSFNTAKNFAVGKNPQSVTIGYFNNDNIADLAVANTDDGNVSILLGKDDSSFDTAKNFAVGRNPQSVAIGDFNNDGRSDLAVTNYDDNSVFILRGNGDGSFGPATNLTAGTRKSYKSLTIGDFNGDGRPDLAVADNASNNVSVILNTSLTDATVTITDNDKEPTISISDVNIKEGNDGTTNATFTVSLSNPSTQIITVDYATADGTATFADNDYTKIDKTTLTFAPGETSKTVNVTVNGDTLYEVDETFKVNLSNAVNGTIITASATGTIVDDDELPIIAIEKTSDAAEPNTPGKFTLTRRGNTTQALIIKYTIAGTATNETDYTKLTGTDTFKAGEGTAAIDISPIKDNLKEGSETVQLQLQTSLDYTIDPNKNSGTIVIADDEQGYPQLITPKAGLFQIQNGAGTSIKFRKTSHQALYRNELSLFTVDDNDGTIVTVDSNGTTKRIASNQTGYQQAVLDRAQVVFSSLSDSSVDLQLDGQIDRYLQLGANDQFGLMLVTNSSIDELKRGGNAEALFSFPGGNNNASYTRITQTGAIRQIAWEDAKGGDGDFNDLGVEISIEQAPNVIGAEQQGSKEVIDLRSFTGKKTCDIRITGDAYYNNTVGLYTVDDTDGKIGNLNIGDVGYVAAALSRAVFNGKKGDNLSIDVDGGTILNSFIIANSSVANVLAKTTSTDAVFFGNTLVGNADKADHVRLLGDNKFGFEDLWGGGDRDFNDVVLQVAIRS